MECVGPGKMKEDGLWLVKMFETVQEKAMTLTRSISRLTTSSTPALLTVPTDVFAEIASYLLPLDILHLARSARAFNTLLMSKNSKHIWRAARANTDLPYCPDNLSEPMYACLVYEKGCQRCGAETANELNFTLRVRLCKTCYILSVKRGSYLLWRVILIKNHTLLFAIVPHADVSSPVLDIDFERGTVLERCARVTSEHFANKYYCEAQFLKVARRFEELQAVPEVLAIYTRLCYLSKLETVRHAVEMESWYKKHQSLDSGRRQDDSSRDNDEITRKMSIEESAPWA